MFNNNMVAIRTKFKRIFLDFRKSDAHRLSEIEEQVFIRDSFVIKTATAKRKGKDPASILKSNRQQNRKKRTTSLENNNHSLLSSTCLNISEEHEEYVTHGFFF